MASPLRPRSTKQVIAPRLLARAALLAYLGDLPWSVVQALIKRGKLPGPLWKCSPDDVDARWDRKTVDRALDAESGIPGSVDAVLGDSTSTRPSIDEAAMLYAAELAAGKKRKRAGLSLRSAVRPGK